MKIEWLPSARKLFNIEIDIFLETEDFLTIDSNLFEASICTFDEFFENNNSLFSNEELLFLKELVNSRDKDNLLIAFTIIDEK